RWARAAPRRRRRVRPATRRAGRSPARTRRGSPQGAASVLRGLERGVAVAEVGGPDGGTGPGLCRSPGEDQLSEVEGVEEVADLHDEAHVVLHQEHAGTATGDQLPDDGAEARRLG